MIKNSCTTFPDSTELSIAIINNDQAVYIGFIKQGDSLIRVDNKRSVFGIGSITKIFTSTLLAQLVTAGEIDLNEPIENQLKYDLIQTGYDNSKITYKTLANHTSGLPKMPHNYLEVTENQQNFEKYKKIIQAN